MVLGSNSKAIGKDNITIEKTGEETTVKVKVTSQSGFVVEEYVIAILERSANNNLDEVKLNGKTVNPDSAGIYYIGIPNSTKDLDIEAIAEDTYAVTTIEGQPNNSYIATLKDMVIDGKTIYEYEIVVKAENGEEAIYTLKVEILEANYDITDVFVGKDEATLEKAELREDRKLLL